MTESVITDLAVLSSLTAIPLNYTVIDRTSTGQDDANLYPERLLNRKYRYLSYRREKISDCTPSTSVLVGVKVCEGSTSHERYRPLMNVYGTGERAFRKKTIFVSYVPLGSAHMVVSELAIRSRSAQAVLPGYKIAGELNSLVITYSTAPVVRSNAPFVPPVLDGYSTSPVFGHKAPGGDGPAALAKPKCAVHPLTGIPFELNRKYVKPDSAESENLFGLNSPQYEAFFSSLIIKTPEQINMEYDYRFILERQVIEA